MTLWPRIAQTVDGRMKQNVYGDKKLICSLSGGFDFSHRVTFSPVPLLTWPRRLDDVLPPCRRV